jgi:hypothetical protein
MVSDYEFPEVPELPEVREVEERYRGLPEVPEFEERYREAYRALEALLPLGGAYAEPAAQASVPEWEPDRLRDHVRPA